MSLKQSKLLVVGCLATAVLATAGYFAYQAYLRANFAFAVDGKKYTKQYVRELTQYPKTSRKLDDAKATRLAYDYILERAAAKKLGVNIPASQITDTAALLAKSSDGDLSKAKDWFELEAYHTLISIQFAESTPQISASGFSFVFYFGHRIERGYDDIPEGFGDAELIKKDRDYAESKAKELRAKLVKGQVMPEQLIETIKVDAKLSYVFANQHSTYSTDFNTADSTWQNKVYYSDIVDFIGKAPKGVSEIKVGKTAKVPNAQSPEDYAETLFYFTDITQTNTDAKSLKDQVEDQKKKMKAVYYE